MEPLRIKRSELTARQSEMWDRLKIGMSTHITEEDGTLFAILSPADDDKDGPPAPASPPGTPTRETIPA